MTGTRQGWTSLLRFGRGAGGGLQRGASDHEAAGRAAWRGKAWWLVWAWLALMPVLHAGTVPKVTVKLMVTNAQGTVVATMDRQGNVTYTAAYRPYGQQVKGAPQAGPGYTGHVNDPATGLVYMQQRYYDPTIKRFISPDPITPTPGNIYNINRYVYANDNPVRYTDPDGRCPDTPFGCGSLLKAHVQWRMSHPDAPADGLEKAAFASVGVMVGATLAPISPELGAATKIIIRKVLSSATKKDGLGRNPFKGKTPKQVDKGLRSSGLDPKGPDPLNGKGGYVNSRTGRSYHIDPGGKYKKGTEYPHVDVNRTGGSKLPKRKYPLGDRLNDNQ